MKMVNIACGSVVNEKWINLDFNASTKGVIQHNVLKNLPFKNNEVDVIYISHFVEHIFSDEITGFLQECFHKLKSGGIIRIVVPDLENICREYIEICNHEPESFKHDWIIIELIDQLSRKNSGGLMGEIYQNDKLPDPYKKYIYNRVGEELPLKKSGPYQDKLTFNKVKTKLLYLWLTFIRILIPKNIRNQVFLTSQIGENHRWMYDKYSVSKLLNEIGFSEMQSLKYYESNIPDFRSFSLDENIDGSPRKGISSLYMEAKKP